MKGYHHQKHGIGILFDNIYFIDGMRTPFGKYCGTLAQVSPTDLGIVASRAALQKCKISAGDIDQLIAANIGQSSGDAYFLPRHIGLFTGLPLEVPALMVQRICGSGFETLITGAEQITLGKAECRFMYRHGKYVTFSNWSALETVWGYALGRPVFKDMLWEALDDTAAGYPMGFTAENVAKNYKITRQECDQFALLSFNRALAAQGKKYFEEEITPVNSTVFEMEGLKTRKFGCREE